MKADKSTILKIHQENVLRILEGTPDHQAASYKIAAYVGDKISYVIRKERSKTRKTENCSTRYSGREENHDRGTARPNPAR